MSVDIWLLVTLWVCWTGRSCRSTSGTCTASPRCGTAGAPSGSSSSWTLCHKTRRCRSAPGISDLFASGDQIKRLVVLFVPMPINSNILHRSRMYELDIWIRFIEPWWRWARWAAGRHPAAAVAPGTAASPPLPAWRPCSRHAPVPRSRPAPGTCPPPPRARSRS